MGLILILLFVGLFVSVFVFAFIGTPSTYQFTLEPQTSRSIDYRPFRQNEVSINVVDGTVTTYVFSSEPELTGTKTFVKSFAAEKIDAGNYIFFTLSLTKGSAINTQWFASEPVTFYLIQGSSSFSSWEGGSDTQLYDNYGKNGDHQYTTKDTDNFYFAFENGNSVQVTISIQFTYTIKVHDLSNPVDTFEGSVDLTSSDIKGKSLVFYNPDPVKDATVNVEVSSRFSFSTIFYFVMGVFIFLWFLSKRGSKKVERVNPSPTAQIPGAAPPITPAQTTPTTIPGTPTGPAKMPATPTFKSRPPPVYCPSCGSAVLSSAKFCTECGTKLA